MDLSGLVRRGNPAIPDLGAFGEHLCVPFEVRPFKRARLLWLNDGWFLQSGIDVREAGLRQSVSQALLEEFAVSSNPGDFRSTHGRVRTLFADRYGGTGGMPHGGSGRCGLSAAFNAKGIGRTPLAPDNVDWDHSHGFLWLDEALRETVAAQIAAAELPHGAVPIVAIIDTGLEFSRGHGEPARRRAIVVRPNFLRPAHFERSVYFGDAGKPGSAQFADAQRVRRMVGALVARDGEVRGLELLREIFLRSARQIGAARAHRLWQGRFLSSNISLDGAWVDFGSFRAVANWRRAQGLPGESFGEEGKALRAALESLLFYLRKYGGSRAAPPAPKPLLADVERAIDEAFANTVAQALGVDAAADPRATRTLSEIVHAYYRRQQRERVRVDDPVDLRRPWVYDLIRPGRRVPVRRNRETCNESFALAMHLFDAFPSPEASGVSLLAAQRWFHPRHHLLFNLAAEAARRQVRRLTGDAERDAQGLAQFIDRQVSRSRRHWPLLPARLEVLGQVCRGYSSALYCRERDSGDLRIWIEGCVAQEHWSAFGERIPQDDLEVMPGQSRPVAGVEVPGAAADRWQGACVIVAGRRLAIPAAQFHYVPRERPS